MEKILEMRRERAKLVKQARDILDKAEKENRDLTAEEKQQYDRIFADIDKLAERIEREEKLLNLERLIETSTVKENPEGKREDIKKVAFRKWILDGWNALTPEETRALSFGTDASGGYLVPPQEFIASLIKKVDDAVYIRKYATKLTLTNAKNIGIPTLETNPSDPEWTTELQTGSEDTAMAFGKREMAPNPLAKRIKISNKLLRFSAIPVEDLVRDRFAYKFSVALEKAYLTGDGTGKPLGLFVASNNGIPTSRDVVVGDPTNGITPDGLIDVKYALKAQYVSKAVWIMHRDIVKTIAKLKDNMGRYLWQTGLAGGQPDTLLDRPVIISEFAPNTIEDGAYVLLFGDLSFYYVLDSLDLQLQRLVELYAETNQIGYIARYEGDGAPVLAEAFVRGQILAS